MGKWVKALFFVLVFTLGFLCFSQVTLAQTDNAIYIHANGTVEGTDIITKQGNVYTFTLDAVVNGDIIIQKNDIVIDGNGHILQDARLVISELNNITVQNLVIQDTYYGTHGINVYISGIEVTNSSMVTIKNNTVTGTTFNTNEAGIKITGGNQNVITQNTIARNQKGLTISNIIDYDTFIPIEVTVYNNNFYNDFDVEFSIMYGTHIPESQISFCNGTTGNYWQKYNGTDTDNNKTGDTPYVIAEMPRYTDDYPLMEPYGNPIVAIPEFQAWMILPVLGAVATVAVILKKKLTKTPNWR
ncbi:MAG: NosD domain-containing protein [Candidatus Bathyarchaeia archaeon]|jgi:parallel beta-helix repeat protein